MSTLSHNLPTCYFYSFHHTLSHHFSSAKVGIAVVVVAPSFSHPSLFAQPCGTSSMVSTTQRDLGKATGRTKARGMASGILAQRKVPVSGMQPTQLFLVGPSQAMTTTGAGMVAHNYLHHLGNAKGSRSFWPHPYYDFDEDVSAPLR